MHGNQTIELEYNVLVNALKGIKFTDTPNNDLRYNEIKIADCDSKMLQKFIVDKNYVEPNCVKIVIDATTSKSTPMFRLPFTQR